jgi:hypothetical protein
VGGGIGRDERDRVRAFVDPQSGDAHFTPNFAELVRLPASEKSFSVELATGIARSAFSDERFLPHDLTEFRVSEPITVMGAQTASSEKQAVKATRTEPRVVLTIVPAFRYAAGFRVYGRA